MSNRTEAVLDTITPSLGQRAARAISLGSTAEPSWHVLWTRSNCEQRVHDQLRAKGFEVFLPKLAVPPKPTLASPPAREPMFRSYLFLRHAIDAASYVEVSKARGLVRILGERWNRLAAVPAREIESIRTLVASRVPTRPHPYLEVGRRIRIVRGPLANVEGILVRSESAAGLVVLSVDLLRRSVAVEIEYGHVAVV